MSSFRLHETFSVEIPLTRNTCLECSIEEDFVTWKERLWPAVCAYFGLDATEGSIGRDYDLVVHTDMTASQVFSGEPYKLGSYQDQKP